MKTWLAGDWQPVLWSATLLLIAVVAGLLVHRGIFSLLVRLAARTKSELDDVLLAKMRGPARLLFPLLALLFVDSWLSLPASAASVVGRLTTLGFIACIAWSLVRALHVVEASLVGRQQAEGDADTRRLATQLHILRRVLTGVIVVIAGAIMLLTFPRVRAIGASLLASAGLVALVAGIALRPAVGNIIAGIQIALSRSLHIDDVVVVDGEWGRIEEISLTVVVVRTWDLRRLVYPISHFTEKPFQNWTRTSPQIIGSVFLHADYRLPVEPVRQELHRILKASPHWDGAVWALVVVEAGEWTMRLRATMSAASPTAAWDLRCEVREKLIDFLQREYPECLPRRRAEQGPLLVPQPRDAGGGAGATAAGGGEVPSSSAPKVANPS